MSLKKRIYEKIRTKKNNNLRNVSSASNSQKFNINNLSHYFLNVYCENLATILKLLSGHLSSYKQLIKNFLCPRREISLNKNNLNLYETFLLVSLDHDLFL